MLYMLLIKAELEMKGVEILMSKLLKLRAMTKVKCLNNKIYTVSNEVKQLKNMKSQENSQNTGNRQNFARQNNGNYNGYKRNNQYGNFRNRSDNRPFNGNEVKILVTRKTGSSRLQGEKLDRETQSSRSNFEKFMGKGGRIFYLCKI